MKLKVIIEKNGRLVDVVDAATGESVDGAWNVEAQLPLEFAGGDVVVHFRRHQVEFEVKEA